MCSFQRRTSRWRHRKLDVLQAHAVWYACLLCPSVARAGAGVCAMSGAAARAEAAAGPRPAPVDAPVRSAVLRTVTHGLTWLALGQRLWIVRNRDRIVGWQTAATLHRSGPGSRAFAGMRQEWPPGTVGKAVPWAGAELILTLRRGLGLVVVRAAAGTATGLE